MPEYLHPGVYVVEVANGVKPIEGVETSTGDVLGPCIGRWKALSARRLAGSGAATESDDSVALLQLLSWAAESLASREDPLPMRARVPAERLLTAALALLDGCAGTRRGVVARVERFGGPPESDGYGPPMGLG
jgi:hypothetical protein